MKQLYKKKRGISIMIGYILLITIAIVMSIIVYQWLKTYIPKGEVECPSETSFFVRDYSCSPTELNITLQNNGRFEIGGYFITATESPDQDVATKDLSTFLKSDEKSINVSGRIFFTDPQTLASGNILGIGQTHSSAFTLSNLVYKIELTPLRFQKVGEKNTAVTCSKSRIEYEVSCA